MKLKVYLIVALASAAMFSCVSPKKLEEEKWLVEEKVLKLDTEIEENKKK